MSIIDPLNMFYLGGQGNLGLMKCIVAYVNDQRISHVVFLYFSISSVLCFYIHGRPIYRNFVAISTIPRRSCSD